MSTPASMSRDSASGPVYVVDLDGTLIKSDTLLEQLLRLLFKNPLGIGQALKGLLRGRARFKEVLTELIDLPPHTLNFRQELLDYLSERKTEGAYIVLATASHARVARHIAKYCGVFDEIMATEGETNLKGTAKADALTARFPNGFVYAGDCPADMPVWLQSEGAILADVSKKVEKQLSKGGTNIIAKFSSPEIRTGTLYSWMRALRVHHWSKNFLLFIPVILAHEWANAELMIDTGLALLLLLAVTSSTYFINDLADLESDRQHETKRTRPIASGAISIPRAIALPTVLLPVALLLSYHLDTGFAALLSTYMIMTVAYSFGLKRIPLLDVFVISLLFTLRLLMGSSLLNQPLPEWLFAFSLFLFFSLATAKRHVELIKADRNGDSAVNDRGYQAMDVPLTLAMGIGSGLMSVVIMILYLVENAFGTGNYTNPDALWVITLCLSIWIGRIWLLTHRGLMDDDPVSFALKDPASLGLGIIVSAAFLVAL